MGLEVNIDTNGMQKRYMALEIIKGDGVAHAKVTVETGFYSDKVNNKGWVKVLSEELYLDNELLSILMTMKASQLGIGTPTAVVDANSFQMIETLIYGVVSGQIPVTADFTVNTTDAATGLPLATNLTIMKGGVPIYDTNYMPNTASHRITEVHPVTMVTFVLDAFGYFPVSKTVSALYGTRVINLALTPNPEETTTTTAPPPPVIFDPPPYVPPETTTTTTVPEETTTTTLEETTTTTTG